MFNKVCIKMYKSTFHNSSKDKTTVKIQTSYFEDWGTGVNSRKDHYHFNVIGCPFQSNTCGSSRYLAGMIKAKLN